MVIKVNKELIIKEAERFNRLDRRDFGQRIEERSTGREIKGVNEWLILQLKIINEIKNCYKKNIEYSFRYTHDYGWVRSGLSVDHYLQPPPLLGLLIRVLTLPFLFYFNSFSNKIVKIN